MSVSGTSQEAYDKIRDKLGYKQAIVFEAIKRLGAATNEAIAEYLGWPINQVTGRVTELKRFGMVAAEGRGINKTGFSAQLWSIRDPNDKNLLELTNDCAD